MEDLDFSVPRRSSIYDGAVALEFFKAAGTVESVAQGTPIFTENEKTTGLFSKGAKMYFLLDGEVGLSVGKKVIGGVSKGEIFGEMALLAQMPRSATAVAKTACKVISLDDRQFRKAMEKTPEFALMLMSIIIERLRQAIAKLTGDTALSDDESLRKRSVFDRKVLADLEREFEAHPPVHVPAKKVLITEGEVGALMYVVLQGRIAVSVKKRVVERVGPGGVLGEMALVDKSTRLASAVAETDCTLLQMNRGDFLDFVKSKPDFSLTLLKAFAERLRYVNSQFK